MLHAERQGAGPDVVLVHGFTQTAASWASLTRRLASRHHVTAVDAPDHGRSSGLRADLWQGAGHLAETGGRATYIGYSMGGRLCLHLALAHPDLVDGLILVSTTAGIDDPDDRAARRAQDDATARRIEAEGVPAFLDWWLAQPLFATLDRGAAGVEDRLANTAAGLAASLRCAGTGAQEPLWDRLDGLEMPVLVVAGALDARYVELAARLVRGIGPNAALAVIPDAGHACHLERPDVFGDLVEGFLH